MRSRCTVSIFLTGGVGACAEGGETCAEASAVVVTAFLARGFRAFFIVASAVIGLASVRLRVGEPAEYAPSGKKTQSRANDAQGAVATGYREPHTYTMLGLGWVVFIAECILALSFGVLFWHFWTHENT